MAQASGVAQLVGNVRLSAGGVAVSSSEASILVASVPTVWPQLSVASDAVHLSLAGSLTHISIAESALHASVADPSTWISIGAIT